MFQSYHVLSRFWGILMIFHEILYKWCKPAISQELEFLTFKSRAVIMIPFNHIFMSFISFGMSSGNDIFNCFNHVSNMCISLLSLLCTAHICLLLFWFYIVNHLSLFFSSFLFKSEHCFGNCWCKGGGWTVFAVINVLFSLR